MVDNIRMIETTLDGQTAVRQHEVKVGDEILKLKKKGWNMLAVLQNIIPASGSHVESDSDVSSMYAPMIITTLVLQHPKK